MFRRQFTDVIRASLYNTSKKTYSNMCRSCQLLTPSVSWQCLHQQPLRFKSKKSQNQKSQVASTSEAETEEETWDDKVTDKHSKVMNLTVKSPRIDGVLKSGLGIARNKIETLFYESKIRVNGKKLLKKSDLAQQGDEIDIVKGPSVSNPSFLNVARVEVLDISEKGDNVSVKIRRCKNLTVEKYDDYASQST